MKFILAMMSALFFSNTTFAVDIDPGENVAQLKVNVPATPYPIEKYSIQFVSKSSNTIRYTKIPMGQAVNLFPGAGCLEITGPLTHWGRAYKATQCGIELTARKMTTISLSRLDLFFDLQLADVDFGPTPYLNVQYNGEKFLKLENANSMSGRSMTDAHDSYLGLILPAGKITAAFEVPFCPEATFSQDIDLSAGRKSKVTLDVPDHRATLQIDKGDNAKFERIDKHYMAIFYQENDSKSWHGESFDKAPEGKAGLNSNGFKLYYKFFTDQATQAIRLYPVIPENTKSGSFQYYLFVNDFVVPLDLKSGKVTRVPVVEVNVHSFKLLKDGIFKITASDASGPYDPKGWVSADHPNNRSLILPYGYHYTFAFYGSDDSGSKPLVDTVNLDLLNSN